MKERERVERSRKNATIGGMGNGRVVSSRCGGAAAISAKQKLSPKPIFEQEEIQARTELDILVNCCVCELIASIHLCLAQAITEPVTVPSKLFLDHRGRRREQRCKCNVPSLLGNIMIMLIMGLRRHRRDVIPLFLSSFLPLYSVAAGSLERFCKKPRAD